MSNSSDSDEDELFVVLDSEGRIEGTSNIGLRFQFGSWTGILGMNCLHGVALQDPRLLGRGVIEQADPRHVSKATSIRAANYVSLDDVLHDCQVADNPLTGATYWLSAAQKPRFLLEQLARDIFDFHTQVRSHPITAPQNCAHVDRHLICQGAMIANAGRWFGLKCIRIIIHMMHTGSGV
jgi:hypothetical protein